MKKIYVLFAAAFVVLVVSAWLQKVSSDLNWDEALSYRVYARHPLTAVALYLEPNNHPLESLYRSIFWSVPGFSGSGFLRLPGLVLLAGYLLALGALLRSWWRSSRWLAVSVLGVGLLAAAETQVQVLQLRGYFLSMLLLLVYFGYLIRASGLTGGEGTWTTRSVWVHSTLVALLCFTVPSNLLLVPALWLGVLVAYGRRGADFGRGLLQLGGLSALLTVLAYVPIGVGYLVGVNRMNRFPGGEPVGPLMGLRQGLTDVLEQARPLAVNEAVFAGLVGAILLLAVVLAFRRRETWVALIQVAAVFLTSAVFSAFVTAPVRIKSPMIVILWFSLALAAGAATERWRASVRLAGALVLVLGGLAAVPRVIDANRPHHTETTIVSILETVYAPEDGGILVGVDTDNLAFYAARAFGEDAVIRKRTHIEEAFGAPFEPTRPEDASWKTALRQRLFPELEHAAWNPDSIRVLVLARETDLDPDPGYWSHPLLDAVTRQMSRRDSFRKEPYEVVIWRR